MMILSIIAVTLLVIYLGIVLWKNKDIPHSISETYYLWPSNLSWIFRSTMIVVPALILPDWLEISEESIKFLVFLSCSGMIFVGCSPNVHQKQENNIHITSAIICCISGLLWVLVSGYWYIILGMTLLGFVGYAWKKQALWWIEIITMSSIVISLFIK